MVREICKEDLPGLFELYLHLHETRVPEINAKMENVWNKIAKNDDYHIIVAQEDGMIVSSCTVIIIPNLTRNGSSYALVENVVTHEKYRNKGFASACLDYANKLAVDADCYKMMLITGSGDPKTHEFYKNAGYCSEGKTAYYKLLRDVEWKKH